MQAVERELEGGVREKERPHGQIILLLTGVFRNHEPEAIDTDEWALANNYVSVVPVSIDMTAHSYLDNLKNRFRP
jgi:5'-nucleotidase